MATDAATVVDSNDETTTRVIECDDVSNTHAHIKDRLGTGWSDLEIYEWICSKWRISKHHSTCATTKACKFAWSRAEFNVKGRKSKGGVDKLQTSLETFGIRLDWRSPP